VAGLVHVTEAEVDGADLFPSVVSELVDSENIRLSLLGIVALDVREPLLEIGKAGLEFLNTAVDFAVLLHELSKLVPVTRLRVRVKLDWDGCSNNHEGSNN